MQPTLLILAAGMGSRYGSLKQLDPMGPNGETVLDYSVFDAIRAGFGKVVFVIRRDFAPAFESAVGAKFAGKIEVGYAYQDLNDLPEGFCVPEGREKPWGTAHALRAARDMISTPFAVINADDFYGVDAYRQMAGYFERSAGAEDLPSAMVGYRLKNTLSMHGPVNRGLCRVEDGALQGVEEHSAITRGERGALYGEALSGERVRLGEGDIVSMNFWGFTPAIFPSLEELFIEFLEKHVGELRAECYIPTIVDRLIRRGATTCRVLETNGTWFGVTYPEDKPSVQASIQALIARGEYPEQL